MTMYIILEVCSSMILKLMRCLDQRKETIHKFVEPSDETLNGT